VKNLLKASFVLGLALVAAAGNTNAGAQTIAMNGLGSSAIFLELGLAASASTSASPAGLGASCLWTGGGGVATDNSTGASLTDTGNSFVAWEPGTGTCAAPIAPYKIYAYLQTDSVVGNRCLFNGTHCTISYPTTTPTTANLILTSGEVSLTSAVATALNSAAVDTAGTDIRPEDAKFAITRALGGCNTAISPSTQYLGLGYSNGSLIKSSFSTSTFNVINFSLPSSYSVTALGATPILVVTNSSSATSGFNASTASHDISDNILANILDGHYSYTDQTANPAATTGSPINVIIREPLSGTYNTMEYNAPNTTANQTSQDVGFNQAATQKNCNGSVVNTNPLNIMTASTGLRQRAIGTGQEVSTILANPTGTTIGYFFWSVANAKTLTAAAAPFAKYMTIDTVDPLFTQDGSYTYTGTIPTTTTALANVTLDNVASGSYPLWSSLRLVNVGSTPTAAITNLAAAAQNFVPTGTTSARPDFVAASLLSSVHSHFTPPGQSVTPANGSGSLGSGSACSAPELGGDVGGQTVFYTSDSRFCSMHGVTTGQTGLRK
jgi:hypothetical protein